MMRWLFLALVAALIGAAPNRAVAQSATSTLTPAQAQAALSVLQDAAKRDALIATLQTIAGPTSSSATPASPATKPATPVVPLAPDSLGANLLDASAGFANKLTTEFVADARTVTDFPLLWRWATRVTADPDLRNALLSAAWRLIAVAIIGLLVERLLAWALHGLRRLLIDHAPASLMDTPNTEPPITDLTDGLATAEAGGSEALPPEALARPTHVRLRRALTLLRRLPYAFGVLVIDLVPVGGFVVAANATAATDLGGTHQARTAIVLAIGVYAVVRVVLVVARIALSPRVGHLRLVGVTDAAARTLLNTIGQVVVIGATGYAIAEILALFGLEPAARDALLRVTGLAWDLCLVAMVIRCRAPVAAWLGGHVEAATGAPVVPDPTLRHGAVTLLRRRLAKVWHHLAIVLILGLWLVYAFEIRNGVAALLHFIIFGMLVLGAARLAAILLHGALARALRIDPQTAERYPSLPSRAAKYAPALRLLLNALIAGLTLVALLQVWGVNALIWFSPGALGDRVFFTGLRLAFGFALAAAVWEGFNAMLQAHVIRLADEGLAVRAIRLRTLLPMLRTTLLVILAVMVSLMTLSEIGINIAPLLAGAGIIGVAIGFGSQKLVQDLITGIFLLLENTMQVGDSVTLGGLSGVVEHLSIRTIRLRAGDGAVHIIPFSSVTTVTNANRGEGNAPVSIQIAFEEDTDRVSTLLVEIADTLRAEPDYKTKMTGPLQLWGVDQVGANSVTIVGQIPCTDGGRWPVQREFNRRVKQRFQAENIQLAVPTQAFTLRHPLDVRMDQPTQATQPSQPTPLTQTGATA